MINKYLKYLFENDLSKSKCPSGYVWDSLKEKCVKDPGGYYRRTPHFFFGRGKGEEEKDTKEKNDKSKDTSLSSNGNNTNGTQTQQVPTKQATSKKTATGSGK